MNLFTGIWLTFCTGTDACLGYCVSHIGGDHTRSLARRGEGAKMWFSEVDIASLWQQVFHIRPLDNSAIALIPLCQSCTDELVLYNFDMFGE